MANQLKKQNETFEIVAKGMSEAEAMEAVFQQVKKEAYTHCKGYLIEMHVESFELIDIEETKEIQRYLYVFLPKERKHVQVKARVQVVITYIEHGLNRK